MNIIDIGGRKNRGKGGNDGEGDDPRDLWLKRQANLVVSQLPEDEVEAMRVLLWAARIVRYLRHYR